MPKIKKDTCTKKNIHEGHRNRLLNLVVKAGLENVSLVQAMEFILTFIIPRGDVNPLAHRLLDKFHTIPGVFDADISDLQAVPGIGEISALKLSQFSAIFNLYIRGSIQEKEDLSTKANLLDLCENLVRMLNVEEFHIIGLNNRCKLAGRRLLARGSISMVGIKQNEITMFLNSVKPAYVALIHNHPGGSAIASQKDLDATTNIEKLFQSLGVSFIDHFIVGSDGIYSIKNKRMDRKYSQS